MGKLMMNRIKNDAKCDVAGIHRRFSLSFSMTPGDIAGITRHPTSIKSEYPADFSLQKTGEW
jgi:hypothetical protein